MSDLKIKQISNKDSLPNSYIAFNGSKNVWQKIRHTQEFSSSDLTNGVLLVDHELGHKFVQVTIYDEDGWQVGPDNVRAIDTSTAEVHLQSFASDLNNWVVVVS